MRNDTKPTTFLLVFFLGMVGMMFFLTENMNKHHAERQTIALNECKILMTYSETKQDTLKVLSSTVGDGYVCINLMAKEMK